MDKRVERVEIGLRVEGMEWEGDRKGVGRDWGEGGGGWRAEFRKLDSTLLLVSPPNGIL